MALLTTFFTCFRSALRIILEIAAALLTTFFASVRGFITVFALVCHFINPLCCHYGMEICLFISVVVQI